MTAHGGPLETSDAELVAGVLGADRDAFAAVYDRYGPRLYDFAFSMLRQREDASDAVADAFIIFAERLEQLREPDRLRPWLYAIVRTECLRRLKGRKRVAYGDEEQWAAMADDAPTPEESATADDQQEELRRLVWDAAAGLADRDRALLDLHLRQGLEGAELGHAMGVSASNAYVMLSRLRDQVERSLGALLVARLGRADCVELDGLLGGWDGRLNPLIRKRVARHVDGCTLCSVRRSNLVSPTALLASVPVFAVPVALRDRVLADFRLVSSGTTGGPGGTGMAGGRRTPGGRSGAEQRRGLRRRLAAVLLALLAGLGALVLWLDPGPQQAELLAGTPDTLPGTVLTPAAPTPRRAPSAPVPSTPTSSVVLPTTPPTTAAAPGQLTVSRRSVDLGARGTRESVLLGNSGELPIDYALDPQAGWLAAGPAQGRLEGGATVEVTVTADRTGLAEGEHAADLRIGWDRGTRTVQVFLVEEHPPVVGRPVIPRGAGCSFPVTASVTDESGLDEVTLHWSGPASGSVSMQDGAATVRITLGGDYTFTVVARDSRGNTATGPSVTQQINPCPQ